MSRTITIPKVAEIRKAIAAGIAADVPLLISDITGNHWAQADLLNLAGAFVGAAVVVFGVPNDISAKVATAVAAALAKKKPSMVGQATADGAPKATP